MIGEPRSPAQFREINLVGGVLILIAALAPPIMSFAWPSQGTPAGGGCVPH